MSGYPFECYAKSSRGKIIARKTIVASSGHDAAAIMLSSVATLPGIERIEVQPILTVKTCPLPGMYLNGNKNSVVRRTGAGKGT